MKTIFFSQHFIFRKLMFFFLSLFFLKKLFFPSPVLSYACYPTVRLYFDTLVENCQYNDGENGLAGVLVTTDGVTKTTDGDGSAYFGRLNCGNNKSLNFIFPPGYGLKTSCPGVYDGMQYNCSDHCFGDEDDRPTIFVPIIVLATPTPTLTPTPTCINSSPNQPSLSSPANGSSFVVEPDDRTVFLTWESLSGSQWGINCSGNNNQFKVYFDTSSNPSTLLCTKDQSATSCQTGDLEDFFEYYWKLEASNGYQSAFSPIWSFQTSGIWMRVLGGDAYLPSVNQPVPQGFYFLDNLAGIVQSAGVIWSQNGDGFFGFGSSSPSQFQAAGQLYNPYDYLFYLQALKNKAKLVSRGDNLVGAPSDLETDKSVYHYTNDSISDYLLDSSFYPTFVSPTSVAIFLINGSLSISNDFNIPSDRALVFIVRDNIIIEENVSQIAGLYITSGVFRINSGNSNLLIEGMVYTRNREFQRTYKQLNTPTYQLVYQPKYVLSLLEYLGREKISWQEIMP